MNLRIIAVLFVGVCHMGFGVAQESARTTSCTRMACALYASAAGDALGRITEFMPSKQAIYSKYPNGVNWFDDIEAERMFLPKDGITDRDICNFRTVGYPYTDDTVMMRIVLEETKNFWNTDKTPDKIVDAMAVRFVQLFDPETKYSIDPLYDVRAHGLTNKGACLEIRELMDHGKTWRDRDKGADRASLFKKITRETGCGSVMRVWPIGFYYHNDIQQAIKIADMQSCITHRNPGARAACAAAVAGFATLCNLYNKNTCGDSAEIMDTVAQAMIEAADRYNQEELAYKKNAVKIADSCAQTVELNLALNLKHMSQNELLASDMLRYAVWAAKNNINSDIVLGTKNDQQANYRSASGALLGWRADETIAAVLYVLLRHNGDFFKALAVAINTPGDSDSIACLVGAFAGYAFGKPEVLFGMPHAHELEHASEFIGFCESGCVLP